MLNQVQHDRITDKPEKREKPDISRPQGVLVLRYQIHRARRPLAGSKNFIQPTDRLGLRGRHGINSTQHFEKSK
ncbi:hypothetical protein BXT86_03470 [candidate division WOR-3 bacterium 4484_100]|uniref:Uncharacterized protein n=1 Tax=candidate division WOR-3 bacterium 4484_100 TaxID=1936077 RepID=A0A1V4QG92_UNCW3|nr:MAG: hypothetical protein BXT86_03470 [candidate division WOR-3 bacterium 4484_100]